MTSVPHLRAGTAWGGGDGEVLILTGACTFRADLTAGIKPCHPAVLFRTKLKSSLYSDMTAFSLQLLDACHIDSAKLKHLTGLPVDPSSH